MTVPQPSPIAVAVWSVVALWLLAIGLVQAFTAHHSAALGAALFTAAGGSLLARIVHVTRSKP